MKNENQLRIETPIGTLFAERGEDGFDYWVDVCIALNNGEVIQLAGVFVDKKDNELHMGLWEDPLTEDPTRECRLSEHALLGYPEENEK